MLKLHTKTTKRIVIRDLLLFIFASSVILIIVTVSDRSYQNTIPSFCTAVGQTSGSYTEKVNVSETNDYIIWARVEAPVPIEYNYSPGEFNPLYLAIDNTDCFKLGESQSINLNDWSWVNTSLGSTAKTYRFHLTKGVHVFTISGLYSSVDELELLNNDCRPVAEGLNCLPQKNGIVYLPNKAI